MVFDLLIIFADGTEKVVEKVSSYEWNYNKGFVSYTKNGYIGFMPIQAIKFIGKEFDYNNRERG